MESRTHTKITIGIFVVSLIGWGLLIYFVGSERIIELIGAKNGYLVMFLVALFGGVSSVTGLTHPATIITLASGGLDPLFLALASAAGVSVGDTVYFALAHRGSRLLRGKGKTKQYIDKLRKWLINKPSSVVWATIYGYAAFTPLPNDILTIAMGLARQPYLLVITALVLGNFTHTYIIAQFGRIFPF